MYNFRTDLALERRDLYNKAHNIENDVDGIETEEEKFNKNIKISRVKVTNENGEKAINKPQGNYITIDIKKFKFADGDDVQKASEAVTKELKVLIEKHIAPKDPILVVGLGNIYVTPDALGPKVVNEVDITRHLLEYMPEVMDENTREVSAISPGVLGTTGIETLEILKGIVDNTKPKLVIVIDALASRSIERISSSVQLADTGIVPGAGVANARKELTISTLGVPVIAIGIPTVVEAATIAADSLTLLIQKVQEQGESNDFLNKLQEDDKYTIIKEILAPEEFNFIVTPKEIDDLIEKMKDVIARGINFATALEGALKLKEISYINATGYPAGELKHGPIAMLDETMPVLSILMNGSVYDKLLSNSEEAKARNARMVALTNSKDEKLDDLFEHIIRVPDVQELFSPIIAAIPLQLIAYYIAEFLGKDVDQPRNLAKSVTVE